MTIENEGAGAAAGADAGAGEGGGSLLDKAAAGAGAGAGGDPAIDWMPEKFRVVGAEGKLDEAASARKLADSYKALEAHKGTLPAVPATPEDYKIEPPKGADGTPMPAEVIEAFTGDPLFKAFAKDAHAAGLTNDQLQFVVDRYLTVAPQLLAENQKLSLDEASAELSALWKDEATFKANLASSLKAVNGFGAEAADMPGSRARLTEKFGNDPDFIAFAASVAAEMKEDGDTPHVGAGLSTDSDVEALQKGEAYWNKNHPDHAKVKAQVDAFYTKKFGDKRR